MQSAPSGPAALVVEARFVASVVPLNLAGSPRRMNIGPISETRRRKGTHEWSTSGGAPTEAVQRDVSQGRCFPFTGLREGPWDSEDAAAPSPGRGNTTCPLERTYPGGWAPGEL